MVLSPESDRRNGWLATDDRDEQQDQDYDREAVLVAGHCLPAFMRASVALVCAMRRAAVSGERLLNRLSSFISRRRRFAVAQTHMGLAPGKSGGPGGDRTRQPSA